MNFYSKITADVSKISKGVLAGIDFILNVFQTVRFFAEIYLVLEITNVLKRLFIEKEAT